ncbi:MAG: hypothetical protein JST28_10020 [Acidobacteria bacterium]|nr:hypothetical protein [Acidobacteriota bacterium]
MDASQPNSEFQNDRASAELGALLDALIPTGLLYIRQDLNDLDEHQRKELLLDVYGPGDLNLRLDNLHFVLPLLHKARSIDEQQFLLRVFLPWVGMRRRLRVNRNRVLDEFAKMGSFTPGTPDEYAHLVNVYRSIVADLIDPYLTLLVACYQFVEGGFTNIVDANFGQGERNKDEYLTSRIKNDDPQVRLLSGYSPIVRNAVSHSGSHGVTYQIGKVLFRDIKRGSSPTVVAVEWTEDELLDNITRLYECILSIDAAVGIFGLDISDLLVNDWTLYSQALHYTTSPEEQAEMRSQTDAQLELIRISGKVGVEDKLKVLLYVLQINCRRRRMPLNGIKYSSERNLIRVEVPGTDLDENNDEQIRDRVADLSRYAILAESVFAQMADTYVIAESQEVGKEQVVVGFKRDLLHDCGEQRAGLLDLIHDATIRVNGKCLIISVDFEELAKQERESLGETFPRRDRAQERRDEGDQVESPKPKA